MSSINPPVGGGGTTPGYGVPGDPPSGPGGPGGAPTGPEGGLPIGENGEVSPEDLQAYLEQQLGIERGPDGKVIDSVDKTGKADGVGGVEGSKGAQDVTGTSGALPAPGAEKVGLDKTGMEGGESFANQVEQAVDEVFIKGHDKDGKPIYKDLSEVSADDLAAVFLKLGINDPANNPKSIEDLMDIAKDLKQGALESQRAELEKQAAQLKEAEKKSGYAKAMSVVAAVVIVAVAVVVAACTFGSTGALVALAVIAAAAIIGGAYAASKGGDFLQGAMMGAMIGAALVTLVCGGGALLGLATTALATSTATAIAVSSALVIAATQIVSAKAKKDAADAATDAEQTGLNARKWEKRAEEQQKDIEAKQQLIRLIMEGKSALIDAVMKMLNNKGATNEKIMSISVARA